MEPNKLDIVYGWWGVGRVTDVAIGQGNCRVVNFIGSRWVMNSDITRNETAEERAQNGGTD